jgi:uncharacterized protein involved in exopolysaccharide biosynthesis
VSAAVTPHPKAAANRRVFWILVAIGAALFLGSLFFIISRAY